MNSTETASAGTLAESPPPPPPPGTGRTDLERLSDPFPVDWLHFKPEVVKGNQALAVAYLKARDVQDRLDAVLGPANWKTEYTQVGPSSVECRLSIRIAGEWVGKADVGSFSAQSDAGDQMKAAYSDALKRAAVQWGVGRYLYQLSPIWCPWDNAAKRFTQLPQLPAWAKPAALTHDAKPVTGNALPAPPSNPPAKAGPEMPKTGAELLARLAQFEAAAVAKGVCKTGELIARVSKWCAKAGHSAELVKLDARGIEYAVDVVKEWNADIKSRATAAEPPPQQQQNQGGTKTPNPPPAGANKPNGATLTVRAGLLDTLKKRGDYIEKEFRDPLDSFLGRVHDRLTFAELVAKPDVWDNEAITAIADDLKRYIDGGVPY